MALLVLLFLLGVGLHVYMQVAVLVDVHVEVVLGHSRGSHFYGVVFLGFLDVDGRCRSLSSCHEVCVKEVVENFGHPIVSANYW